MLPRHECFQRYSRNLNTLSCVDQDTLGKSRVAILGLGGLGGWVCELLARIGVGALHLIDGDRFDTSNLNRQLLSLEDNIGCSKAQAAAMRLKKVNTAVRTTVYREFAGPDNLKKMIENTDLVVDCLDTIQARFHLQDAANALGMPIVSGAIAGVTGQVTVIFPGDPGFEQIYGRVPHGGTNGNQGSQGIETWTGNLSFCAGFIASLQASEAVKVLTGKGQTLRNKLLIAELWTNTIEVMDLA